MIEGRGRGRGRGWGAATRGARPVCASKLQLVAAMASLSVLSVINHMHTRGFVFAQRSMCPSARRSLAFSTPALHQCMRFQSVCPLAHRPAHKETRHTSLRRCSSKSDDEPGKEDDMDARIKRALQFETMDVDLESLGITPVHTSDLENDPELLKLVQSKSQKKGSRSRVDIASGVYTDEQDFRLKGSLELNPYSCPGCGSPFQSKDEDAPGYLPKEKMQTQLLTAKQWKEQQETAKILRMAGLDPESDAARQLLADSGQDARLIRSKEYPGKEDRVSAVTIEPPNNEQVSSKHFEGRKGRETFESLSLVNDIGAEISPVRSQQTVQKVSDADADDIISRFMSGQDVKGVLDMKLENSLEPLETSSSVLDSEEIDDAEDDAGERIHVCQRCHKLQHYGAISNSLRPGWSTNEFLTPERFVQLLSGVKTQSCVVLCLVDLFDLQGSLLADLKKVAGPNQVVIAANKIDLLPKDISEIRVLTYVHQFIKKSCGFPDPPSWMERQFEKERQMNRNNERAGYRGGYDDRGAYRGRERDDYDRQPKPKSPETYLRQAQVHLVSCKNGYGFEELLRVLMSLARANGDTVYVLGSANVGKSSFINQLIQQARKSKNGKVRSRPTATVSPLPGTTLDFLKIRLPNGVTLVDTPGIINKSQLTTRLTHDELKSVIPTKRVKPVTIRLAEGKCVLIGGLAQVELAEGRPFLLTFFVSADIKLHPTACDVAANFAQKHIGTLLSPPFDAERLSALPLTGVHKLEITGDGWKKSVTDVVISGLGWFSVTGAGTCKLIVRTPEGISVDTRPALLPYETWENAATFTGGKLQSKNKPKKYKKRD